MYNPERTEKIRNIIKKWEPRIRSYYFFSNIPPKKLSNAIESYAFISSGEKVFALRDDTAFRSAKCGTAITSRGIYEGGLNFKNKIYWDDAEDIYFCNGHMTGRNFGGSYYGPGEGEQSIYRMFKDIVMNLIGVKVLLRSDIVDFDFPSFCIGCNRDKPSKKIEIELLGPHKPDSFRRHSSKFGIPGLIIGGVLGSSVRSIIKKYSVPVCNVCSEKLPKRETMLEFGWISSDDKNLERWYCENRHLSFDATESDGIEIWFRNVEFAKDFCRINKHKVMEIRSEGVLLRPSELDEIAKLKSDQMNKNIVRTEGVGATSSNPLLPQVICPKCGQNKFDYDRYFKEYACKNCGWQIKVTEGVGTTLSDPLLRQTTCQECGRNEFDYDHYWKEYTCKNCGWQIKAK